MLQRIAAIWVVAASAACAIGAGTEVTVETIDARLIAGTLVSLTDKALVLASGGKSITLPRKHLVEVVLADSKNLLAMPAQSVMVTTDGHHLSVSNLRMAKDRVSFGNPLLGQTSMPLGSVHAIYCPALSLSAGDVMRMCRKMKIRAKADDVLVVEKPQSKDSDNGSQGGLVAIGGALKGIVADSKATVLFHWQDKDGRVAMKSVRAILLASTAGNSPAPRAGVLTGRRGSTVAFASITLAKGANEFSVTTSAGAATVPLLEVAAIRFTSSSVVELSSLKPLAVREHGFFDGKFPHRLNRSVAGGPIILAERTYRSGLGLHSFCELTYALDGKYARFVTVAGIDDVVRPAGNADLTILADGKILVDKIKLTGKDKPQTLRLNVTGAQKLTIRVGFGDDRLDVSDHLDLAAARLILPDK